MPRQEPKLTYQQRKVARDLATKRRQSLWKDVDDIMTFVHEEAHRLGKLWKKRPETILHMCYQKGRIAKKRRGIKVDNAARQVDGWLEGRKLALNEEEKDIFKRIKVELITLGGPEKASQLPEDLQSFLKEKALAFREHKNTAASVSMKAIVQDTSSTIQSITAEIMSLNKRTGIEVFLFAAKSSHEQSTPRFYFATPKAERYVLHGMKKHSVDISREFEAFVSNNMEGLIRNHNDRLKDVKMKIRNEILTGHQNITGHMKLDMHFSKYNKLIVAKHGVQLVNWPEKIPFVNSSNITSIHSLNALLIALIHSNAEKRCRWVKLTVEEWERRKEEVEETDRTAGPTQRKRKRNCAIVNSEDESSESEGEQQEPLPKKPKKAKTTSNKENVLHTEKTTFKAKTKKTADKNRDFVADKKQKEG
ncbi:hypothetical protein M422DRAFT_271824 [Sphaerobolus stellatus SS14]|uniref:Uncharacterized protein n=1 Tax=Sphaerobolus stellatus (strain SS14) TaxID=990650 RepID=A0A0C9UNZ5_SPHS4|nr:hypothetical protein M422DRAFT_271824 [Sphaerobolus stellatus SS14]